MSADEQVIAKVLAILGPNAPSDARKLAKLKQTIRRGLGAVATNRRTAKASGRYGVTSYKQKRAAAKAATAIRRLLSSLRDPDLVSHTLLRHSTTKGGEKPYSTEAGIKEEKAYQHFKADLEWLQKRYDVDAKKPLAEKGYRANNWSKQAAVKTAAEVLRFCGLPLTLNRNGSFVRIATVIYDDDESGSLYEVCRAMRQKLR